MAGVCAKLHNEKLLNLNALPYSISDQIKKVEICGVYNAYGEMKKNVLHLVGKPKGKRQSGKSRSRREDNIKPDLTKGNRFGGVNCFIWLRIRTGGGLW
jgi:hypothetical protein